MRNTIILIVATLAIGALFVWQTYEAGKASEKAAQWEASVASWTAASETSWKVGFNLETGLNEYRKNTETLNEEVAHATINDTGNRFDAGSVQRTAARIAAGEAARQRRE